MKYDDDRHPLERGSRLRTYAANLLAALCGCPGYLEGFAKGWESGHLSGLRKGHVAGLADARMGVAVDPDAVAEAYQRGFAYGMRAHASEFTTEPTR